MNYLIWIGGTVKINNFIKESLHLGICRKLPFLPRKLNKGSKIYMASLQIKHVRNIEGKLRHEINPVIFGEFTVDHIEFIIDEINPLLDEKFKNKGLSFTWITKKQARKEPKRIDGKRLTVGAIYAVNYPPDLENIKVKERHGIFTIYEPYIEVKDLKFFRGIKEFNLQNYLRGIKK